jgi:uroporphyrinogen decarboxylase
MNKRDTLLNLISDGPTDYTPAAFFLHFDPVYHTGQPAIDKHLEFFRHTGMDLVKIQYEQKVPMAPAPKTPAEWANIPVADEAYFEPTVRVVEGLVKAAKGEALVILTLYSPFMWARHFEGDGSITEQLKENPDAVKKGLERTTQSVINLVRACKKVGVDGFYASTQGGEATRFPGIDIFEKYIKPTDLAVWDELASCTFNILHVCDYEAPYDDLTPFLDYPGHVVNSSLHVGDKTLTTKELAAMFNRPFMGGLERKATIATGMPDAIRAEVNEVLAAAPDRFILAADCTVPGDTPWDNLKIAIDTAHGYKK